MSSFMQRARQRPRSKLAELTYNLMTENGPDLGSLNDYAIEIIEVILRDFYKLVNCGYHIDFEKKEVVIHVFNTDGTSFIFKPKKTVALRFLESKLQNEYKIRFATKEDLNEQTKRL